MKVLVAYDGTLQSKDALKYGAQKVSEKGGEVVALHVFDTYLFVGYDSHPRAREMARADSLQFVEDARKILKDSGVKASVVFGEGDPQEEIMDFARANNVDVLLCPPRYKSIIKKFRKAAEAQGSTTHEDSVLDNAEKLRVAVVTRQ